MKRNRLMIGVAVVLLAVAAWMALRSGERMEAGPAVEPDQALQARLRPQGVDDEGEVRRERRSGGTIDPGVWEERVDALLGDDRVTIAQAVDGLLLIVGDASAPEPVRHDALEHALNLIDDGEFGRVLELLESPTGNHSERMVQAVLDDTLNRPEEVQLAAALVAGRSGHPAVVADAKELLEFWIDEELDADPAAWPAEVQRHQAARAAKAGNE